VKTNPSVETVADTSSSSSVSSRRAAIIATARTWLGVDYSYGGSTRSGIDCSGLVQQVMRTNGINLPRTAAAQYAASTHITRAQLQPGDLVFQPDSSNGHVEHVGIFIGNGKQIDAQQDGVPVAVHTLYPQETEFGRVL
jgi:cell wall-associated NlpC family hydrolase